MLPWLRRCARRGAGVKLRLPARKSAFEMSRRGGGQAVDVDPRVRAEQDAVRVDQEDLAVRLQRAQDLAGVLARRRGSAPRCRCSAG